MQGVLAYQYNSKSDFELVKVLDHVTSKEVEGEAENKTTFSACV